MASDFDQLRRKLAQAIHTGDCKSARVLGAKLQFAARTPAERGAVHRAQSRLRSCVTGLSGSRGRRTAAPRARKNDDLFIGIFPAGISYADRSRERDGDYMRIAFLPFDTLKLEWRANQMPAAMRKQIERHARAMTKKRGQDFQVSQAGQTVRLGSRGGLSGARSKLNDNDREQWISNDEYLYNWQRSSRKSMRTFIRENRAELDEYINGRLNKPPLRGLAGVRKKDPYARTNAEGLTLLEWVRANRFGSNKSGPVTAIESQAWRRGEDPTERSL